MKKNMSGVIFGCALLVLFGLFGIIGSVFIINTQKVENATKITATIEEVNTYHAYVTGSYRKIQSTKHPSKYYIDIDEAIKLAKRNK